MLEDGGNKKNSLLQVGGTSFFLVSVEGILNEVNHFVFKKMGGGGILYFNVAQCFMIQPQSFLKCHKLG